MKTLQTGDRFIANRTAQCDVTNNYDRKSEIFALSHSTSLYDKLGMHSSMYEDNDENAQLN